MISRAPRLTITEITSRIAARYISDDVPSPGFALW
jgi:hypothetical protein